MPRGNKDDPGPPQRRPPRRELRLHQEFWDDLQFWRQTDRKIEDRLVKLIEAVMRDPFEGIGKPEPLKNDLRGLWSRRLTDEHRVVYRVTDDAVHFLSARDHYPRHL